MFCILVLVIGTESLKARVTAGLLGLKVKVELFMHVCLVKIL